MNCFHRLGCGVRRELREIHLVDRFLILFMAVLLAQSAYSLFSNEPVSSLDVMTRTTASAIFGYFISANFIKKCRRSTDPSAPQDARTLTTDGGSCPLRSQIGFTDRDPIRLEAGAATPEDQASAVLACGHLQIIIVAVVGLISLCVLLIYRDFFAMSAEATGTLSQLRDFVSSCVGFLIGCATDDGTGVSRG